VPCQHLLASNGHSACDKPFIIGVALSDVFAVDKSVLSYERDNELSLAMVIQLISDLLLSKQRVPDAMI